MRQRISVEIQISMGATIRGVYFFIKKENPIRRSEWER